MSYGKCRTQLMEIKKIAVSAALALAIAAPAYAAEPLVTDVSGALSAAKLESISTELESLHREVSLPVDYRLYTVISDSKDGARASAKEFLTKNPSDGKPAILIAYSKADRSVYIIEDQKLAPYAATGYMISLAKEIFADGVTAEKLEEFAVRTDSTLIMSVEGDFAFTGKMPVNKEVRDMVDVRDFSKLPKSKAVNEKGKEEQSQTGTGQEGTMTGILAFALALASVAFVVIRRKKKLSKK